MSLQFSPDPIIQVRIKRIRQLLAANPQGLSFTQLAKKMRMYLYKLPQVTSLILQLEADDQIILDRDPPTLITLKPQKPPTPFLIGVKREKPQRAFWCGFPMSLPELRRVRSGKQTHILRPLWLDFLPYERRRIAVWLDIGREETQALGYQDRADLLRDLSLIGYWLPCPMWLYDLQCPYPRDWAGSD